MEPSSDYNSEWVDITQEFIEATKELKLGELLHDDMFGLFEAMSAIEMMDPKMDAGMVCNRDKKVLNFEQSVKEGKLKIKDLTSEEKIGIIDDTYSRLVSWLEGHSLAQTVFTNLYLHNPLAIDDKCLRSFSLIILKLVEIIRDFVYRGNVVEEEDFQPTFLYPIPCTISDSKACGSIRDVEEEMSKKVKSYQKTMSNLKSSTTVSSSTSLTSSSAVSPSLSSSSSSSLSSTARPSSDDTLKINTSGSGGVGAGDTNNTKFTSCDLKEQKDHQLNVALFARLKFSRLFYQSLSILKKETLAKNNLNTTSTTTTTTTTNHHSHHLQLQQQQQQSSNLHHSHHSVATSSSSSSSQHPHHHHHHHHHQHLLHHHHQSNSMKINSSNSNNHHWAEDADKYLQQSSETISVWQQTLSLGIKPEITQTNSTTNSEYRADYPTIMGFEPLINQRFLPPTFPRYTKMKSRKEAIEYMEYLVSRIRHVIKITDHLPFHMALDFLTEFSKSSSPPSCVLSRSLLQVLYLPNGTTFLCDLIREDVRNFIQPPSIYQKPSFLIFFPEAREVVDVFFEHCSRPMYILLQINGHNRARQRDKLASVLEELATIQDEADKVDSYLNTITSKMDIPSSHLGYFSTWVLYHILRVMIQYLLSGFELELYSTHEYPYIYWYLYEFLYGWMASTLYRARSFIAEQNAISELRNKNINKKVKSKKRKQKPHQREWLINQALQQLCGGYYKTVSAFRLEGKLKSPWSGYNREQIRYEHRFAPFKAISAPPPVSYTQYHDTMEMEMCVGDVKTKATELYATACKCFQQAKVLFETVPDPNEEISSFIKVAKTNFIVIKLLLSGQGNTKTLPEFDFSINNKFPVIRIL